MRSILPAKIDALYSIFRSGWLRTCQTPLHRYFLTMITALEKRFLFPFLGFRRPWKDRCDIRRKQKVLSTDCWSNVSFSRAIPKSSSCSLVLVRSEPHLPEPRRKREGESIVVSIIARSADPCRPNPACVSPLAANSLACSWFAQPTNSKPLGERSHVHH